MKKNLSAVEQAFASEKVRAALADRARLALPRAQREAAKAGRTRMAKGLRIESGVRPGTKAQGGLKRPYARVVVDYPEEARKADAGANLSARNVMRRASRG